jgi:diguanylate cyclase (GGDEF)-like protein
MIRLTSQRVLLIGDSDRQVQGALAQAAPGAQVTSCSNYFEGIAELSANSYTAVLAAAEPIERRPEAAVKVLRDVAGDARIVLFGHPTLEPLSRKMLDFGCDDYVIAPTSPGELNQIFGAPLMRIAPQAPAMPTAEEQAAVDVQVALPSPPMQLAALPLAEVMLDALSEHPGAAAPAAAEQINQQLAPTTRLVYLPARSEAPDAPEGQVVLSHAIREGSDEVAQLHLMLPRDEDENAARHFMSRLAELFAKLHSLQERHNRLQRLAITDELTGVYNARYFRHFLSRILERARQKLFPVTLLIFDIDNFKKYNDQYGHGVGDEILKQTASLIKRCCREHDLVARLGGDEFAVVFWEKEGPRQPKENQPVVTVGKPPQTPEQVLERFKKLLAKEEFRGLGPSGQGVLTISGGVAVFPYHANTMEELIALADRRLMFGAKQSGKNTIFLVGGSEQGVGDESRGSED